MSARPWAVETRVPSVAAVCAVVAIFFSLTSRAETLPQGKVPAPSPAPTPALQLSVRKDAPRDQLPFWKRNESVIRKMKEERAIVVSVRREDLAHDPGLMRFTMQGAGWVAKPKDFCFRLGQQYHRLLEISDHFRTVSYDPRSRQLFLITQALGYQARMILQVTPVSDDWRSELQWEVIWGHFKGMKGVMGFERIAEDRTEMSVNAVYEAKELPVPKFLIGFALEVVTQKVAEKMRSYIESKPASALDEPPPALKAEPMFLTPVQLDPVAERVDAKSGVPGRGTGMNGPAAFTKKPASKK